KRRRPPATSAITTVSGPLWQGPRPIRDYGGLGNLAMSAHRAWRAGAWTGDVAGLADRERLQHPGQARAAQRGRVATEELACPTRIPVIATRPYALAPGRRAKAPRRTTAI